MNQNAEGEGRADAFFRDPDGNRTPFALVEYREGIYMGYRYAETVYDDLVAAGKADEAEAFYKETVAFPFGYGLDYTDFEWELAGVSKERVIKSDDQYLTVQVAVTNVGKRAGSGVTLAVAAKPQRLRWDWRESNGRTDHCRPGTGRTGGNDPGGQNCP